MEGVFAVFQGCIFHNTTESVVIVILKHIVYTSGGMEGVYAVLQGDRSDHDDCHPPGLPGVSGRLHGLQHMAVRMDRR